MGGTTHAKVGGPGGAFPGRWRAWRRISQQEVHGGRPDWTVVPPDLGWCRRAAAAGHAGATDQGTGRGVAVRELLLFDVRRRRRRAVGRYVVVDFCRFSFLVLVVLSCLWLSGPGLMAVAVDVVGGFFSFYVSSVCGSCAAVLATPLLFHSPHCPKTAKPEKFCRNKKKQKKNVEGGRVFGGEGRGG